MTEDWRLAACIANAGCPLWHGAPTAKQPVEAETRRSRSGTNTNTGQCVSTLTGHSDFVCGVCFSPDGSKLASCSKDKSVKIWNLITRVCVHVGRRLGSPGHFVCTLWDTLAVGCYNGNVLLVDSVTVVVKASLEWALKVVSFLFSILSSKFLPLPELLRVLTHLIGNAGSTRWPGAQTAHH